MVPPASHRIPRVPWYSGSRFESDRFQLQGFHLLWPTFPRRSPTARIGNSTHAVLQPPAPACARTRFGLFRFRSPLLAESRLLSLPPGTEMVHFPGLARIRLWIQRTVSEFCSEGFPHSDIPGSTPACGSPKLIAAGHVLHRLLAPRHPPYALSSLTTKLTQPLWNASPHTSEVRTGAQPRPVRAGQTTKQALQRAELSLQICALSRPSRCFGRAGLALCPFQLSKSNKKPGAKRRAVSRCSTGHSARLGAYVRRYLSGYRFESVSPPPSNGHYPTRAVAVWQGLF